MPTGLAPPRAWLSAYAQVTGRDASGSGVPLARGCARARPPRALVLTLKPRTNTYTYTHTMTNTTNYNYNNTNNIDQNNKINVQNNTISDQNNTITKSQENVKLNSIKNNFTDQISNGMEALTTNESKSKDSEELKRKRIDIYQQVASLMLKLKELDM